MSLCSMTGFGRAEKTSGTCHMVVEIKTLNHKYLDISVHVPPKAPPEWELLTRKKIEKQLRRGRVDVYLTLESRSESDGRVFVDTDLAQQYYRYLKELSQMHNLTFNVGTAEMAKLPGVIELEESFFEPEEEENTFEECLDQAICNLLDMRRQEGKSLREKLNDLIVEFAKSVEKLENKAPEIEKRRYDGVVEKVGNLLSEEASDIEELDIRNEVALAVQRTSVVEELDRLKSHVEQFEEELTDEGSGRKLGFIAGEMLRETNTIAAKISDVELSRVAVGMKTVLEDVREQLRNIE